MMLISVVFLMMFIKMISNDLSKKKKRFQMMLISVVFYYDIYDDNFSIIPKLHVCPFGSTSTYKTFYFG